MTVAGPVEKANDAARHVTVIGRHRLATGLLRAKSQNFAPIPLFGDKSLAFIGHRTILSG
jgi:hypothetical protein